MIKIKLISLDKDLEVKKQPVGNFIKALKALKNLPNHLGGIDKLNEQEILSKLPSIIVDSYDEIAEVVTIATSLTKEDVDNLHTEELIELVGTIIEVNEFNKIGESVKKKFGNLNLKPRAK